MVSKVIQFVEKRPELKHFVLYFGMALVGFSTNVGSRIIYREFFGLPFGVSVVFAYFTGMIVGFVLSKIFVFKSQENANIWREMIKFTIVSMIAMLVTLAGSLVALAVFNWYFKLNPEHHRWMAQTIADIFGSRIINRELASHLGGTCGGFVANFFGHKQFTFRNTGYWDKMVNAKTQYFQKSA